MLPLAQPKKRIDIVVLQRTDEELLSNFVADRDSAAFAALMVRYAPRVLAVCRGMLHQKQDEEDACQDTFLALMRDAGSIRHGESLGSWLHGVAYRVANNARRAKLRREEYEEGDESPAPAQPTTEAMFHELQSFVAVEVRRLPERLGAVFVLCCLEGESKREAAQKLGLPEGTAASRLAKARKLVQQGLARHGIIP